MTTASIEARLQALEDRLAISDLLNTYAYAIDRHDWEAFRTCFTDEVELNIFRSDGWITYSAADLVEMVRTIFTTYVATQHLSANHRITIEGDVATAWSSLNATHYRTDVKGSPFQKQVGYYEYHLARSGRWRIDRVHQVEHWQSGNQLVLNSTRA